MRSRFAAPSILALAAIAAPAQVSLSIATPHVSIGINVPVYPDLVPVPDAPVYYAPRLDYNYFFFDGAYWVFQGDRWYVSSWYNGPWRYVDPDRVPPPILRVPVGYYRRPPVFFHPWRREEPPRWGEHWGHGWEGRHAGWRDRDPRMSPAPLPDYQRDYPHGRYPKGRDRVFLHDQHYSYQPQDPYVREHYRQEEQPQNPGPGRGGPGNGGHGKGGPGKRPLYPPPPGQP